MVANAAKNEVDLELERLHEEERTHYKVRCVQEPSIEPP